MSERARERKHTYSRQHTRTHIHTHMHIHTYTRTHRRVHIRTHTDTGHTHTQTNAHRRVQIRTHTETGHTHTDAYIHARTHMPRDAQMRTDGNRLLEADEGDGWRGGGVYSADRAFVSAVRHRARSAINGNAYKQTAAGCICLPGR